MWVTPAVAVLVVASSPKLQNRLVIVPVELSVNVTASGTAPLVGLPRNNATSGIAPAPLIELVEPPPLAVAKTTLFVKLPTVTGANWAVTLVEPKPGRVKLAPETMANGPPLTATVPLVTTALPVLVTTKLAWAMAPVARVPKSTAVGVTTMPPGTKLTALS